MLYLVESSLFHKFLRCELIRPAIPFNERKIKKICLSYLIHSIKELKYDSKNNQSVLRQDTGNTYLKKDNHSVLSEPHF